MRKFPFCEYSVYYKAECYTVGFFHCVIFLKSLYEMLKGPLPLLFFTVLMYVIISLSEVKSNLNDCCIGFVRKSSYVFCVGTIAFLFFDEKVFVMISITCCSYVIERVSKVLEKVVQFLFFVAFSVNSVLFSMYFSIAWIIHGFFIVFCPNYKVFFIAACVCRRL